MINMIQSNNRYGQTQFFKSAVNTVDASNQFSDVLMNSVKGKEDCGGGHIILRGKNDADEGEQSLGSWASVQTGVSTSVFKPADFSEDNPYLHVKIWKADGTLEERMVNVENFNPKSADSFEHYAYACYLKEEEGIPITSFLFGEKEDDVEKLYEKKDWVNEYKGWMQQQLDVKNYEGYSRYKKIYERLLKQSLWAA